MSSDRTRAAQVVSFSRAAAAALAVSFLWALGGCRDNGASPYIPEVTTSTQLTFSAGDTLIFDAWTIDAYGYTVPATRTRFLWSVASVSDTYAGAAGVTTIVQSAVAQFPPVAADTLRFRFQQNGDIYQYGFIAKAIMRREGVKLASAWDRIGAFSLPMGEIWTVGTTDSAGTVNLNAYVATEREYYVAQINGVQSVFRGYTVVLSADNLECEITVSSTPAAVVRVIEYPSAASDGILQSLVALTTRGGGAY